MDQQRNEHQCKGPDTPLRFPCNSAVDNSQGGRIGGSASVGVLRLHYSCTLAALRLCSRLVAATSSMFDILPCDFLCCKELANWNIGIVAYGSYVM